MREKIGIRRKITAGRLFIYIVMYLFAIAYMIPLLWMLRTAFIPSDLALETFSPFWPTLQNLGSILDAAPFSIYYANTILIVFGTLAVQFTFVTLAGYAFARLDFFGSRALFVLFLSQLMISPDVLILPNYRLMGRLHLIDTQIGVMLPFFASAMGTFFLRQTIKTIPYELEEAAKMDGYGLFRTLIRIYVPLLRPAYTAFGLISASFHWNDFLWPLVMINSVAKRPLTLGLAIFALSSETGAQWSNVCAATFLVVCPLLILFFLFQRQFTESFAYTGIK